MPYIYLQFLLKKKAIDCDVRLINGRPHGAWTYWEVSLYGMDSDTGVTS